jgi:hypothetical protein
MHSFHKMMVLLAALSAGVALLGMALLFVGTFTVEWTCREDGGQWQCVGPHCNVDADKRFETFRRKMTCERTDWPMILPNWLLHWVFREP